MDANLIHSRLVNLVNEAVGGDYYFTEKLEIRMNAIPGVIPSSEVIDILREAKIPIAEIVTTDLDRIYSGEPPIYFLSAQEFAQNYQKRHGVMPYKGDTYTSESWTRDVLDEIEKNAAEKREYGASLGPYRDGLACYKEQSYFYETVEWQNCAKAVRVMDKFTCKSCGKNMDSIPKKLHVHHEYPIQSMYSIKFSRNFDSLRLKTLCQTCHENLHASKIRKTFGFVPASQEQIDQYKEYLKDLKKAHDEAKKCRFCYEDNWV